ncbi:unnamed protein product [Linum tenue]|uniref:Uncharacterized protein n=1 Tax=Linum tenue TaxID=586396 RepID=A0AAV0QTE8_9ROSI|nr:unnamed protein product [Linum tenue]
MSILPHTCWGRSPDVQIQSSTKRRVMWHSSIETLFL